MKREDLNIAIVGAGIGELTPALALRERGIDATLYEQTDELREVGAAVALSANATRFYERMGLRSAFDKVCAEVPGLIYRDGRNGRVIGEHRAVPSYRERFGGSYWGVHRANLQALLSQAVGLANIKLSHRLVNLEQTPERASLTFNNGQVAEADLVICADGARSLTRRWMLGYDDVLYSGCSSFRGVVPAERMDQLPDPDTSSTGSARAAICCITRSATRATRISCWSNAIRRRGRRAIGSCRRARASSCGCSRTGTRPSCR